MTLTACPGCGPHGCMYPEVGSCCCRYAKFDLEREESGCYCEPRSPSSSSQQVFSPFDITTDDGLHLRGSLTDDYLSLHVSWPGKRLVEDD